MKQCYLDHDGVSVILIGSHYHDNGEYYTQQLVQQGLAQDQDYIWAYYPHMHWTHHNMNQDRPTESFVKITFVDARLATFYAIKWGK